MLSCSALPAAEAPKEKPKEEAVEVPEVGGAEGEGWGLGLRDQTGSNKG